MCRTYGRRIRNESILWYSLFHSLLFSDFSSVYVTTKIDTRINMLSDSIPTKVKLLSFKFIQWNEWNEMKVEFNKGSAFHAISNDSLRSLIEYLDLKTLLVLPLVSKKFYV